MSLAGKKILITGGSGFLGSHLTESLVEIGAGVTVVDLLSTINLNNLAKVKDRITAIDFDITKKNDFDKLEKDYEYIFHLGAIGQPRTCQENPELAFKVNVYGTFNTINFALKNNIKKFIFLSSTLVYGEPKYLPIDEKHSIDVSNSVYNLTKKIGEDLCEYYKSNNLPMIYFRLSNTFGPKQLPDYVIPTMILQGLKNKEIELWNGDVVRDFTFVNNMIDALIRGAESDFQGGPVNLCSGNKIKIRDIAEQVAGLTGSTVKFLNKEVPGPKELYCSNELAKKVLNWLPATSFEDGLKSTLEWFKTNTPKF